MGRGEGALVARSPWLGSPCDLTRSLQMKLRRRGNGYFQRNPVVAELFLLELDTAVEAVCATPGAWPRVNERFRRYIMKRFPFSLVYWTRNDEHEVVAVAHHRRRPGYWSTRA